MSDILFKDIVDAVMLNAFSPDLRVQAKEWVNIRYEALCDAEEWTFTEASTPVTVTAGSSVVSNMPSDFGRPYELFRSDGYRLPYLTQAQYLERYSSSTSPQSGKPDAFSQLGANLVVGPVSSETSAAYTLLYRRQVAKLVNDSDIPVIPVGYHLALVHGGKAEGFKLSQVPQLDEPMDAAYQAAMNTMRRMYLRQMPHKAEQSPAYRPY